MKTIGFPEKIIYEMWVFRIHVILQESVKSCGPYHIGYTRKAVLVFGTPQRNQTSLGWSTFYIS